MPELYLEMVSTADERWKNFRIAHYIKSCGYEHSQATGDLDALDANARAVPNLKTREHGQQNHFLIWYKGEQVGIISGGSAVYRTAMRDEFFKMPKEIADRKRVLNSIVNNTIYHIENHEDHLFARVLALWEKVIPYTWHEFYEVPVCGFETFIADEEKQDDECGSGYKGTGWKLLGKEAGNAKTHPRKNGRKKEDGKSLQKSGSAPSKTLFCKWRAGYSSLIAVDYKPTWEAGEKDSFGVLTAKGAAQRELKKVRDARRNRYIGKAFSATQNKLLVYEYAGAKPKEVLLEVYELTCRLQAALTPDLLEPEWRGQAADEHPTFGHSYTVTEALYHLYGNSRGFIPHVVGVPEANTTHWWLRNRKGEIIDGTKEQFESKGIVIPYADGRRSGFLANVPSKRCVALMKRIGKGWKRRDGFQNFEPGMQEVSDCDHMQAFQC